MPDGFGAIMTLLQMLHASKGETGRVSLHALHWLPDSPQTRDVIAAKTSGLNKIASGVSAADCAKRESQESWDGMLRVGEVMTFRGRSPCAGYLNLFNLGTSGTCVKLAPSMEYPGNFVACGEEFCLPSSKLFDEPTMLFHGGFRATPPATSHTGHPERLLVIITQDDIDLQLEDLHPKLLGRDLLTRCPARGPSFTGPARTDTAKLFHIPSSRWDYGLLEMELLQI